MPPKKSSKLKATASEFKFAFKIPDASKTKPPTDAPKKTKPPTKLKPTSFVYTPAGYDAKETERKTAEALAKRKADKQRKVEAEKQAAEEAARAEAKRKGKYTRQELFKFEPLFGPEVKTSAAETSLATFFVSHPNMKVKEGATWRDANPNPKNRPMRNKKNYGSGRGRGDGRGRGRGRQSIRSNRPMHTVKALEKSENRYVVRKDVPPDEKLQRQVRSLMGKLTPEKFEPLLAQFLALEIGTIPRLRDLANVVFNTALAAPHFCQVYADLCKRLDTELVYTPVENFTEDGKVIKFTALLLTALQEEFTAFTSHEEEKEEDSKLSEEDLQAKQYKVKTRRQGMIRLIGELFTRGIVVAQVIYGCFVDLLPQEDNPPDEDSIEELCRLLATVGKKMQRKVKTKNECDKTLKALVTLVDDGKIKSSRIRFLIADTVDLEKNNWVLRMQKAEAKKISEIHKDNAKLVSATTREDKSRRVKAEKSRRFDETRGPRRPTQPQRPDSQGFLSVTSRQKGRPRKQGGRGNNSRSFGNVQKKPAVQEPKASIGGSFGAFGALDDSSSSSSSSSSDESDEEKESTAVPAVPAVPALSHEEALSKIKSFVKEYCSHLDMEEVKLCVTELGTSEFHHHIVHETLMYSFEAKPREHDLLAQMLASFAEAKIITPDQVALGFTELTTYIGDICFDYPLLFKIIGLFYSKLMKANALTLNFLSNITPEALKGYANIKAGQNNHRKLMIGVLTAIKGDGSDEDLMAVVTGTAGFDLKTLKLTAEQLEAASLSCLSSLLA